MSRHNPSLKFPVETHREGTLPQPKTEKPKRKRTKKADDAQ